jgi:IS5 family transposase
MSLDMSGCDVSRSGANVKIRVSDRHPLIKLANALPWTRLIEIVAEDLKKTTAKGFWWLGRKICVRLHLGAYIVQKLYDLTDRQTEYGIRDNAAYQLFCGFGVVEGWHPPDHTKIEEFRSRLSPETQRILANEMAKVAVGLGFGDPREADFDSTVQEANIAYPADANLMTKLAGLGKKVIDHLKKKTRGFLPQGLAVDMKAVKAKARAYFFIPKNTDIEKRREVFKDLHRFIKQQMRPVVDVCAALDPRRLDRLPWNIRRAVGQFNTHAWRYLLDVGHFTRTHTIKVGKVLSFHAQKVACIKKGKVGKDKEFGRVFQLGRIGGNFLFVLASTSIRMEDKHSLIPLVSEHAALFGEDALESASADKGYWSAKNQRELSRRGVKESGLQRPTNVKSKLWLPSKEIQERLGDRRAGIEPLIGHAKHGGQLGRSRMKSDAATLAAGYASVFGLNLRQLIRHQAGKMKKQAAQK